MRALILVDLQNDFFPGGALAVHEGNAILPAIQKLLQHSWNFIMATKDWHPLKHGSFAATHGKKPGEMIILDGMEQMLWPVHCVQGTSGAEFAPGWDASKVDHVFYKGTDPVIDSYSTFFDNEHKKNTGLGDFLLKHKITELYIAGLATDYCVKFSALDALQLGLQVFVVEDACRGVNLKPGDDKRALEEIRAKGGHVISSSEMQ